MDCTADELCDLCAADEEGFAKSQRVYLNGYSPIVWLESLMRMLLKKGVLTYWEVEELYDEARAR